MQTCCSLNPLIISFKKPFHRFRFHSHHESPSSLDFEMFQTSTPFPCLALMRSRFQHSRQKGQLLRKPLRPLSDWPDCANCAVSLCDAELRLSRGQCSHTLRAGSKYDRRSSIELHNSGRLPQHGLSGCKISIHNTRQCSSAAVDTGNSRPTSDCSSDIGQP